MLIKYKNKNIYPMAERAITVHTSLYPKHVEIIQNHKKQQNFNADAPALQHIIEFFDSNYHKAFIKNILLFIGYPFIITGVLYLISNQIFNLYQDTIIQGISFEALYKLGTVLQLGQLAATTFGVTGIIVFIIKTRKQR